MCFPYRHDINQHKLPFVLLLFCLRFRVCSCICPFFHATAATRARSISWVQTPLKRPACRKCARDTSPSKFDNAPAAARTRVALLLFSRPASRLPATPPAATAACVVPAGLPVTPPAATATCALLASLLVIIHRGQQPGVRWLWCRAGLFEPDTCG